MSRLVLSYRKNVPYPDNEVNKLKQLKLISFKEDREIVTNLDLYVRAGLYPNRTELIRQAIRDYMKDVKIWNSPQIKKIDPLPIFKREKSPFVLREQQMMIVTFKCTTYMHYLFEKLKNLHETDRSRIIRACIQFFLKEEGDYFLEYIKRERK